MYALKSLTIFRIFSDCNRRLLVWDLCAATIRAPFTLCEVGKRPVGRLADQQQFIRIAFHQPSEAEQRKGLLIPPGRIDIQGGDGAGTGTATANSDRVDGRPFGPSPTM
jgi:hypothetical protein